MSSQPPGEPWAADPAGEDNPYRFGPPGPNPFGYPTGPPPQAEQPGQQPHPPAPHGVPPQHYPGQQYPQQQYPPPHYPPPHYPPPGWPYHHLAPTTNGRATAGLVIGIGALLLSWLTILDVPLIVLGLVFSGTALSATKRGAPGRGMAIAGLACSIAAAVAAAAIFVFFLHRYNVCTDRYGSGAAFDHCLRTGR